MDGVVTRFTAPVTHIDASTDGSLVVSASCDMTIGLTNTKTSKTEPIEGHRAPVLSVALDPKLEYLASSSCDGSVRVWRLSDRSQLVSWDCVPRSNSFQHATALGQPAWLPGSGAQLAVPMKREVQLFHRDSWEKTVTFVDPNPGNQVFSVVKFSSCGGYLAASTTEGHMVIWNVTTQGLVASVQTEEAKHICALDWSPELPQVAFCDNHGNFGTIDLDLPPATNQESNLRPEDVPMTDPQFGDTDDEDNDNVISLDKIKNESGFLADDLLDDDDKPSVKDEDGRASPQSDVRQIVSTPLSDLQPPFQPSSTPVSLQYRFMVWNDVGIVKQTNTEEENAIDVEFHDTVLHHAFRVNNMAGHTLAALSKEALVMACEATEDNPSKMVCVMLNTWDGSKEWTVQLEGEEALCVAAGQGYVAVVTDTRLLRVFTTWGTQREVISLPGPVVCMAAHQHTLAVVFHSGLGLEGDQSLSYLQIWLGAGDTLVRHCAPRALPLTPRARLRWLGYSDEGSLCALDMAGMLRKLTPSCMWTPICDVDNQCKGKSDHHFVVGISERFQTIRSVLCKGAFYPPTMPRPTVTEISWQVPLCEMTSEKGQLEEEFWRSHFALTGMSDADESTRDSADRTIKKTLLKLFALACQSGLEMRALSLCQLMSPEVVQLAIKYASKLGRSQLAHLIAETLSRAPPSPPPHRGYGYESSFRGPDAVREPHPDAQPLSQDMFASTVEDQEDTDKENPILALKKKQTGLSSSAMMASKSRRSNPFKKTSEGGEESTKGLAGLTKQAVGKPAVTQPAATKRTSNENKPKKNPFMDWFSSNKESLEEEFPDLDSGELTKVALKRFKEEQKGKPASQNMKKFFGSTTNRENKTENEKESTATNDDLESKKRKNSEDETSQSPQPKKISAASKLKMFSFVKP
ncbi:WD repeat and HMG-box DNA-binding protein 1-like isoform X1 [Homalodisca vitripennis]|uniref:WD repeat and HMG-box DNA-binding protein 1-like isoform X1 n=1 Tax=Homalodisca vitripennis TaxID=197043 RepID=UPI001EECD3A8|nr:WD repeat and HMG-box DNA-binding protein 1-like isoform X1 [Homalodisca vitripennis]